MLENIEVLCHNSIKISKDKIIYIDPFKVDKNYNDVDIVFVVHDHYEHYFEQDIDKVINKNTTIIIQTKLFIQKKMIGLVISLLDDIAGDTEITEENRKVKCDVTFVLALENIYNRF